MMTPMLAIVATAGTSLTSSSPCGPMTTPARRKPTIEGRPTRWKKKRIESVTARTINSSLRKAASGIRKVLGDQRPAINEAKQAAKIGVALADRQRTRLNASQGHVAYAAS